MKNCNPFCLKSKSNTDSKFQSNDPDQFKYKIEEERCKRLYCENVIKALQHSIVEQDAKLTAASHITLDKNKTIQKISKDWEKIKKTWEEVKIKQKNLVQELQTERDMSQKKDLEIRKKIEQWNAEVAHALQLGAGYKQLNDTLNAERKTWEKEMDKQMLEAQKQLSSIETQNKKHNMQKQKIEAQLKETKYNAAEEKSLRQKTLAEITKAQEYIAEYEADIADLKEQNKVLLKELQQEKLQADSIQQQNSEIMNAILEVKKRQTLVANQLNSYRIQMEANRSELKIFYNNKLTSILDTLQKEFKKKLDNAEVILKAEAALREKEIEDIGVKTRQMLAERYREDINDLQKQFKNKISELNTKLSESEQKRISVETDLNRKIVWRENIVKQLHNVMQTQKKEAIDILTSVDIEKCENNYQEAERDWPGGI